MTKLILWKEIPVEVGPYKTVKIGAKHEFDEEYIPELWDKVNEIIDFEKKRVLADRAVETTFPNVNKSAQTIAKKIEAVTEARESMPKCPKCGAPTTEGQKKDGTKFTKCSTNRWNPETKQAEGCNYVDWGDSKKSEAPKLASKAQRAVIAEKAPDRLTDDLTAYDAFKIIAGLRK